MTEKKLKVGPKKTNKNAPEGLPNMNIEYIRF